MEKTQRYGAYILFIMLAIAPALSIFSGLALAPLFILCSIAPLIWLIQTKNFSLYYQNLPTKAFLLLLGWMALSSLWSLDSGNSLSLFVRIVGLFLCACAFIPFIRSLSEHHTQQLKKALYYGTIAALAIFAFELASGGLLIKTMRYDIFHQPEYQYFPHDMNRGATFFALILWVVIAALSPKKKLIAALLWIIGGAIILQLESMAASVAFICGSLTFAVVFIGKRFGILLTVASSLLIIAAIPIIFNLTQPADIIEKAPLPLSAQHRLYIWDFVAEKSLEKPIIGWGLHSARKIEKKPEDWPSPEIDPLPRHPHNIVMQIWLELGAIGLALYILFIGSLFRTIYKASWNNTHKALACSWLVSYLIISMTAYNGWQMWWVASGILTLGLGSLIKRQ